MNLPLRIIMNIALALSILFFPWWVTGLLAVLMIFMFQAFEIILWGFIADTLYGAPVAAYYNTEFLFTLLFVALLILIVPIKRRLIFYKSI